MRQLQKRNFFFSISSICGAFSISSVCDAFSISSICDAFFTIAIYMCNDA